MTKENDIKHLLDPSALEIYGLTNTTLKFKGSDYWKWFSTIYEEIQKDTRILGRQDRFEYFKCYLISVAKMINKKYKQPESKAGFGFQSEFLNEVTLKVKEYYEKDPQKNFFDEFPIPPETLKKDKSIQNWLIKTSEQRLINIHNDWYKLVYREEGINYDKFLAARRQYKKDLKNYEDGFNFDSEKPIEPEIEDFREEFTLETSSINALDTTAYTESSFHYDVREFEDIEEFLIPNSNTKLKDESEEISQLLNRFKLDNEARMRKLFERFDPYDISEVDVDGMWRINFVIIDTDRLWSIFSALDFGHTLTSEGKQFLLLQYTTIALSIIKNNIDFEIESQSSYKGSAILSTKEMQLLATTIAQSFIEINKNYKTLILDKFKNRTKSKDQSWKERLLLILHNVINDKFQKQFTEYIKNETKMSIGVSDSIVSDIDLNIQDQFTNIETFSNFIQNIQYYFDGKSITSSTSDTSSLKAYLSDTNIEIDTIFNFFNPMSQVEEQDFDYITKGALSAVTTGLMNCYKKADDKLVITLTNEENSLQTEVMAKITADFMKEVIAKDFSIKRRDVSALVREVIYRDLAEMDVPLTVSIPEGSEFDSYRSMVEMNGSLQVTIPFATQGDKPLWDNEIVIDDKMVQIIDKSITDMINQANMGKAILKYL